MFIALDTDRKRVSIENATKNNKYFCPVCGAPLIIRAENSIDIKTHFAHKRGSFCYDDWKHDMSEWHFSWQNHFPQEYREVIIEKEGIKHRADICIDKTIIEFQHSPITSEEFAKRNDFYLSCGYQVVWVFDATDKIKNQIGDPIAPMKCHTDDLCWKRAKGQFAVKIPPNVSIYLQYKTSVSVREYANQELDIMLLSYQGFAKEFYILRYYPLLYLASQLFKAIQRERIQ